MLHGVRLDARAWLRARAEALVDETHFGPAKGFLGAAAGKARAFFGSARHYLREAFTAAALTVLGPDPLDAAALRAVDEGYQRQVAYLDRFEADAVHSAAPPDGTFAAQAEQYGASVWGAGVNTQRAAAISAGGVDQEHRHHIGADEPCATCSGQVGLGWVPLGTLRAIGDSECRSHCHCIFEFRQKPDDEDEEGA